VQLFTACCVRWRRDRANFVLSLFALSNAGVRLRTNVLSTHVPLPLAIMCGLVIGKPVGLVPACALAVRLNWATKPDEYSWRQLATAGAFAGIGFTMSLFIAAQALPAPSDFAAAKIAAFAASSVSTIVAVCILWSARAAMLSMRPGFRQ
jgi:Na+:H+ antiporter, NhaA family